MKNNLTVTDDVKTNSKLQGINLLVNDFWIFFRIVNEVLCMSGNLLGTFWTIIVDVYKLLRNELTQESIQFRG